MIDLTTVDLPMESYGPLNGSAFSVVLETFAREK